MAHSWRIGNLAKGAQRRPQDRRLSFDRGRAGFPRQELQFTAVVHYKCSFWRSENRKLRGPSLKGARGFVGTMVFRGRWLYPSKLAICWMCPLKVQPVEVPFKGTRSGNSRCCHGICASIPEFHPAPDHLMAFRQGGTGS